MDEKSFNGARIDLEVFRRVLHDDVLKYNYDIFLFASKKQDTLNLLSTEE